MTARIQRLSETDNGAPLILIVEDEVLIRLLAAAVLQEAGFRVVEAADADEAMTILNSNVSCDAVFTDVNMPGSVDGLALAAYVKQSFPSVPVVVTSGGVPEDVLFRAAPAGVVPKPYSEGDLTQAIARALSKRHG